MKKIKQLLLAIIALWTTTVIAEPHLVTLIKGDKRIDLFGTIHVAKPEFYPLPKLVMAAINKADVVALELDMTDFNKLEQKIIKIISTKGTNPKQEISQILDAEQLKKFNQLFGPAALGMQKINPMILSVHLQTIIAYQSGFTAKAIDLFIRQYANKHNVSVIGLETPDEQMDALISVPEEEGIRYLRFTLGERVKNELVNMEKLWVDNDADMARQFLDEIKLDFPHFYQALLLDRNNVMAERVEKLNKDNQRVFVGIGAAHLYGKNSLVEQLLNAGYQRQ